MFTTHTLLRQGCVKEKHKDEVVSAIMKKDIKTVEKRNLINVKKVHNLNTKQNTKT